MSKKTRAKKKRKLRRARNKIKPDDLLARQCFPWLFPQEAIDRYKQFIIEAFRDRGGPKLGEWFRLKLEADTKQVKMSASGELIYLSELEQTQK